MLKSRIIFVLLGLVFVFTQVNAQEIILKSKYDDAIQYLLENQIIDDQTKFNPDVEINRAEFLKIILMNVGYDPSYQNRKIYRTIFQDVPLNAWYAPYVYEAYQRGILSKEDKFYPERSVTRLEALKMFFTFEGIPTPLYFKPVQNYKDIPENSKVSAIVAAALRMDLILPLTQENFGVMSKIKKGEVAKMLYQYDGYASVRAFKQNSLEETIPYADIFLNVWDKIHSDYYLPKKVDDEKMVYAAIEGMVNALDDPFSVYMPPEEGNSFNDSMEGELEGIGAYISAEDGKMIIVSPLQGSPAQKAGLKPNDQIIKVDDESVLDLTLFNVIQKIKGPKGTQVKLTILRDKTELTFVIIREKIQIKSVEMEMKGEIAVIYLNQFISTTNTEFKSVVNDVLTQNPKGIILDLRNNPGGYLESAIDILGYFIEKGTDVVQVAYPALNYKYKANGSASLKKLPLVVLMNEGSASASEIVAGALQDYNLAKIVGEHSYGKGTVQELTIYNNDSTLKLTVAKWLTPNGRWINEIGLKPDVFMEDNEKTTQDEQMDQAIRTIQNWR